MQEFTSLQGVNIEHSWLTIGSFDGIHLGHKKILQKLTAGAKQNNVPAVVLTFYPHPAIVLQGPRAGYYLINHAEKAELFENAGVDIFVVHPFDIAFSKISPLDFTSLLKKHLGIDRLLIGHGFALGHNRAGNVKTLTAIGANLGFEVEEIPPVKFEGELVSSSAIRELLSQGNPKQANQLLGHPFSISGSVTRGEGRGRTIGIPTANISIDFEQLVPAGGVYVCIAHVNGTAYQAVTNIGIRPTFNSDPGKLTIETHILNFDADIYDERIKIEFIDRLRGEQRFENVDDLIKQIQLDILKARQLLTKAEVSA